MGKGTRGGLGPTSPGARAIGSPSSMMGLDRGMHQAMGMSGMVPNPSMGFMPSMSFSPGMSMGLNRGLSQANRQPEVTSSMEPTWAQTPQRTMALPSYGGPSPEFTVIRNGNEGRDIGMDTPPSPQVLGGPSSNSPFMRKVAMTRGRV